MRHIHETRFSVLKSARMLLHNQSLPGVLFLQLLNSLIEYMEVVKYCFFPISFTMRKSEVAEQEN